MFQWPAFSPWRPTCVQYCVLASQSETGSRFVFVLPLHSHNMWTENVSQQTRNVYRYFLKSSGLRTRSRCGRSMCTRNLHSIGYTRSVSFTSFLLVFVCCCLFCGILLFSVFCFQNPFELHCNHECRIRTTHCHTTITNS